ncbi:MAG: gliding motility protein GldL [Bacteroidales bacterium]|nr:gliding motility protein GldL [Bacteroidales bacterium]
MAAFDFANKKGFKTFMARLYGWGASVVILGALFKINHWEGATWMLLVGLGTEAIIFFFSAFEKPHVEVDWSVVYPELAPQYGFGEVPGIGKRGVTEQKKPIDDLNQLFKQAGVDVNLIQEFGDGLRKFSTNAKQMADVSSAVVANDGFVGNIRKASDSLAALNSAYETQLKVVAEMKPVNNEKLQTVMEELSTKLRDSIEGFSAQVNTGTEQVNNCQKQMQTLTTNITALNNVYGNMLSAMTNRS